MASQISFWYLTCCFQSDSNISGQPGYNPRYDVDGDQTITIVDVQTFAAQWGWPSLAQQP